ncbi:hypothetical protein TrVFT333_009755 [Trichoderma virens FT-333]|nr:hypothetical protein TrVFT333_009755 [Trichoderma virens FT-333]
MRQYENFQNEFSKAHEDSLVLVAEYTNCAGDIATTTWIPDNNVLCGTTVHSDSHNQQYNKPGNLLLCSTKLGQLKAFPDHRIPRPLVEKGENSTTAMRQSQDPWLYSSVVCSDYDSVLGLAYTSSFDKTVKVWKVDKSGSTMTALATWYFGGNVNFVAAAKDGSGRVATAADVPTEAIRIYTVNMNDIANSSYVSFSYINELTFMPNSFKHARGPATSTTNPFIPHPEPEPPYRDPDHPNNINDDDDMHIADLVQRTYLDTKQIVINPNPTIGAVQGPEYASTGLFRREAHLNEDPAGHLLSYFERNQRQSIEASRGQFGRSVRKLRDPGEPDARLRCLHVVNTARDLDIELLAEGDREDLVQSRAELVLNEVDCGFVYEELPGEADE